MGGGIKVIKVDLTNIFDNNKLLNEVVAMMQKIALMDNDSIVWRVLSGFIQGEDNK